MHISPGRPARKQVSSAGPRNRLLAALPADELERIRPHLNRAALRRGAVLQEFSRPPKHVFFIESGLASLQVQTSDDEAVEAGVVGRMGFIGAPVLLGTGHAPVRALMQISGEALAIAAEDFRGVLARGGAFRHLLFRYLQAITVQTSQLVLCNARHQTSQRVARWLLLAHDRLDTDEISITHGVLGTSIGVHRPRVTNAITQLQDAGIVRTQRGCISILDRQQLEHHACGCYHAISREYLQLFQRSSQRDKAF